MQVLGGTNTEMTPKRSTRSVMGPMGSRTMNESRVSKLTETEPRVPTKQTTISSVNGPLASYYNNLKGAVDVS